MTTKNKQLGNLGEEFCVNYLKEIGYEILERNYFSRFGEIDIIVKNKISIAFIEVKTRKNEDIDHILMSITRKKQSNITKTALVYIYEHENEFPNIMEYRFDVMIVQTNDNNNTIEHIENAFQPAETGDFFV
jgi:putative endonuclease